MTAHADIRRQLLGRFERLTRRMRRIHQEMGFIEGALERDSGPAHALGQILDAAAHERWLIEAAIVRMDRGEYGHCRACRGEIGSQRLGLLPYARRCEPCTPDVDRDQVGQIRLQHLALGQLVSAIRDALGELEAAWSVRGACAAQVLLADLALELSDHFQLEERGGYLCDVLAAAPELAKRAEELLGDHIEFRRRSEALLVFARSAAEPRLWPDVRAEFEDLASRLAAHEAAESALVQAALQG